MADKSWSELFAEAEETGGVLPDGDYPLVFATAEARKTQNGKKMYKCKAQVESGPRRGKEIWHNFVVSAESQQAMEIFFRQMKTFGMDKTFWAANPSDESIIARLKNARFVGSVITEEYQGQDQNRIKGFKPAGAGATPPPPPSVAGGGTPPPPPASSTPPPPPPPPAAASEPTAEVDPEPEPEVVSEDASSESLPF